MTKQTWQTKPINELNYETFFSIIDVMYDELLIVDDNYNIVYINKACSRHYGCPPEDMIGRSFLELIDNGWWEPSILPVVYQNKKAMAIKQKTYTGTQLLTIAVPLFDENNEIKYVVMNVRDTINEADLYNPQYIAEAWKPDPRQDPIYKSEIMKNVFELAAKVSTLDTTCILTGESGTGKTMLAKYMHAHSPRKEKPFISLNCASLPNELLESELFGYTKGAFTGACSSGKIGLLEAANTGTILLDEISELSLPAQAKLLHVFQEKEYTPVGSTVPVSLDVKIIAATNKNLKRLVATGQFREDLYYRLNIVEIYIPPLRKRREDIPLLIDHFLSEFCAKYGTTRQISDEAMKALTNFEWKGNVRELRHLIERMVITADGLVIDVSQLPKSVFGIMDVDFSKAFETLDDSSDYTDRMEAYEAHLVREAYEKYGSSRKLAEALSISQTKANNLIRKYIHSSQEEFGE